MKDSRQWRKSSYSGGHGGNCVEVATTQGGVAIRDSKNPNGSVLLVTAAQWANLCKSVLPDTCAEKTRRSHASCLGAPFVRENTGPARSPARSLSVGRVAGNGALLPATERPCQQRTSVDRLGRAHKS